MSTEWDIPDNAQFGWLREYTVTYQKGTVGTLREEEIIGNPCFAAFVKDYPWVFVDEANQEMEAPRAKKVSAKLQKQIDAEIAAGNAEIIEKIVAVTWKPYLVYTYGEQRFPEVLPDERIWFEPLTDENVPVAKQFMRKAVHGLLDAEVEQGLLRGVPIVDGKTAAPPLGTAFKLPGSFWFAWKTPLEIIEKPRVLTAEESSDLKTEMVLPDASAVRAPCTKCKKAKKGFKYCRVVMKHGRTEAVHEEPKVSQKVSQSPIKKEAKAAVEEEVPKASPTKKPPTKSPIKKEAKAAVEEVPKASPTKKPPTKSPIKKDGKEVLLLTNSPNTRSRTPNKEDVGITVVAEAVMQRQSARVKKPLVLD